MLLPQGRNEEKMEKAKVISLVMALLFCSFAPTAADLFMRRRAAVPPEWNKKNKIKSTNKYKGKERKKNIQKISCVFCAASRLSTTRHHWLTDCVVARHRSSNGGRMMGSKRRPITRLRTKKKKKRKKEDQVRLGPGGLWSVCRWSITGKVLSRDHIYQPTEGDFLIS